MARISGIISLTPCIEILFQIIMQFLEKILDDLSSNIRCESTRYINKCDQVNNITLFTVCTSTHPEQVSNRNLAQKATLINQ